MNNNKNKMIKNKISFIVSFIVIFFVSTAAVEIVEECDVTTFKKELKSKLKPYFKYDSAKTSRFLYKTKTQKKEIEVPLFMGEKYRFLFNTKCLPLDIKVEIYNKPVGHKKRKLLYSLNKKEGQNIYAFEPEKSRKMYINYTIPKTEEENLRGTMIFILGYRIGGIKKDN